MPAARVSRQLQVNMSMIPMVASPIITASYAMRVMDSEVRVDTTGGAITVTLPAVAECAGMNYIIRQMASSNVVTIVDAGDAAPAVSSSLTTATGAIGLTSDGERWYTDFTVA